ncbi:hypothetical protein C9374_004900 [Naegleria lovaniensis]|uniref:Protein SEY1 homolog n=1 Tax=Naegleria lovaniensis TaxID=51637 RepID=A0AA88GRQ3_NAELO|nr:uncharacterized protein C9374_004900 [Naegleria lovaniensis]KAG2382933.1 hypothetical protein C9374_004900 [Naegleria lovaniensis]
MTEKHPKTQPSSESKDMSAFVQLVDGDGKFTTNLDSFITQSNMKGKGVNYNILSVFGPQSSGKSTLLNRLFNTHFPTMDARSGRYQVTLGVCMAKAQKTIDTDVLLMDLEGTDSKERGSGDDNMAFERKISLFALAISEVLLVNMWQQDIGRYNAANLSLLRVVFELNLQLFQKNNPSKTLLLFVIRDHIRSTTDLDTLKEQMMKDIEKIWTGIMKPKDFENSQVTDFFDFDFTSLPHKELQPELFEQEIDQMRGRFVDPNHEHYIFSQKYKKSVPIDDFEMYASEIWKVIDANKDLDIPTQKEMLAMYRCDEISNTLFSTNFEKVLKEWNAEHKKKQLVSNFGAQAKERVEREIAAFLDQTKLYVPDVVANKAAEFKERMITEVAMIFNSQLTILKQKSLDAFKKHLQAALQHKIDEGQVVEDFSHTIKQFHDTVVEDFFLDHVKRSVYPGLEERFSFDLILETLEEELKIIIEEYREKQVEVVVKVQLDELKKHIREDINPWVTHPNVNLWKSLRSYYAKKVQEEEEQLSSSLRELDVNDISKYVNRIHSTAREEIITKVREITNVISLTLNSKFEELFKRDEHGMPRVWKNLEKIKEDYSKARQEAIVILDVLFLCRLDHEELDNIHLRLPNLNEAGAVSGFAFPPQDDIQNALKHLVQPEVTRENSTSSPIIALSVTTPSTPGGEKKVVLPVRDAMSIFQSSLIMDENACVRAYESYILNTERSYGDAQRAQLIALQNRSNIPGWIYVALLVLGWNEFYAILSNPIYLLIAVIVIVVFFQSYIKNLINDIMEDPESNPTLVLALRFLEGAIKTRINFTSNVEFSDVQQQQDKSPSSSRSDLSEQFDDLSPSVRTRQKPKAFKVTEKIDVRKLHHD